MPSVCGKFFNYCNSRLFQGQARKNPLKSFHYDNRKFYTKCKKYLITKCIHRKSYFVSCRIKLSRRFMFFSNKINGMTMDGSRWALLLRLFVKYLDFRCPYLDSSETENLGYLVIAMIAVSSENSANFEPESLWNLLTSKYLLNVPHVFVDALSQVVGEELWEGPSVEPKFMGISLFGEFLFYCSVIEFDLTSPTARIRSHATVEEALLIDEISMAITPCLGMLTFILYRNLANSINCVIPCRPREFYVFSNERIAFKVFPSVSRKYCKSRKKVQGIPNLEYIFRKFLSYLGTEMAQCFYFYGKSVLNIENLMCLHHDIYVPFPFNRMADLVYILKYVLDILLFLHHKNEVFPIEQIIYIPEFLTILLTHDYLLNNNNSFIYETQDGYQSVSAMLIALSQFLDFLFIENWKADVWNPFLFFKVWFDVNNVLRSRCQSINDFVDDYKLFPFFQYNDDSYFMGLSYMDNSWNLALEVEQFFDKEEDE